MGLRGTFATILVAVFLLGTSWTGRAPAFVRAAIDPALRAGDVALVRTTSGSATAVAARVTAAGAVEIQTFDAIDVVVARVNGAALTELAGDPAVTTATTDTAVTAVGGTKDLDRATPGAKDSAGNDAIHAPRAWGRSTGAGVVVALIDSGIAAHPDLPAGKVVARVDFVKDGSRELDPAGHGTHLAGIIAAKGEEFRGVAPDARLVDLRVLDRSGNGRMKNVLAAFDWLLRNRKAYGIGVANLSFGAPQKNGYHEDLLSAVVESAWFSGVVVVSAAGNDGPQAGTITTPGSDPFVVTAGSFDDQGTPGDADDRESAFSSRGPTLDGVTKPDVLAPGKRVVSLRARGSQLENELPDRVVVERKTTKDEESRYIRMTGTSASSAFVSGVAALVLAAHRDYSPTKVKGAIVASGRRVTGSATPAVDAPDALTAMRAVNQRLAPSRLLMTTLQKQGLAIGATGVTWEGVTWEAVTWEGVTWEGVTWESVTWERTVVDGK